MPLSKEERLHFALAANYRKILQAEPSGDFRMCRMFNRFHGKKEFCLAEFHGDNLSIPLMFFIDRPVPNVVQAAKEICRHEIENADESTLIELLREIGDEREQAETEGSEAERRDGNADAGDAPERQKQTVLM